MTAAELERVLAGLPGQAIAVLGDFCLDRYLVIDPDIRDVSLETGLGVQHVTAVRNSPGGAGAVASNLAALGVGAVLPLGAVGRDGEGFELLAALSARGLDTRLLRQSENYVTPTYIKPVLAGPDPRERELNRFDIFPRQPPAAGEEQRLLDDLAAAFSRVGALIVSDYAETGKAGVVTLAVREALARLAGRFPGKPILVDSRRHLGEFRGCALKPNEREFAMMLGEDPERRRSVAELAGAARAASARLGQPVFVTMGPRGITAATAESAAHVPAYPQQGPLDPVGAGDAVLAALGCALASGASVADAALLGMLAASITVQQLGTTGTADPQSVRARFSDYARAFPALVEA